MDPVTLEPIPRLTKTAASHAIAAALEIDVPDVSNGSSVDARFLRDIYVRLSGRRSTARSAHDAVQQIYGHLGLDVDHWDTSSGSTVTARAYSRILCAIVGVPRCFALLVPGERVDRWWSDSGAPSVTFRRELGAVVALLDAGPGSRIALVTHTGTKHDPLVLVGHARVDDISSRYREPPWTVTLSDVEALAPMPVVSRFRASKDGEVPAIEVRPTQLDIALAAAANPTTARARARTARDDESAPGRDRVAHDDAPAGAPWPHRSAAGPLAAAPLIEPTYADDSDGVVPRNSGAALVTGGRHDRELDRRTELAAVDLAIRYMTARGWRLDRDMQSNGVGFDLWFVKDDDEAKVEVKGIRSRSLAFNMTPKEWWRCRTDPRFVVLAVTGALTENPYVHVVTREQILRGERVAAGFRVVPADA